MSAYTSAKKAERYTEAAMDTAIGTAVKTGMAWLDLVMGFQREMQRASLQSFSVYSPLNDTSISGSLPRAAGGVQVIPVGEERLNVATRTVPGEVTRIRRRVVAQPAEQEVTLREEKVVVERRRPGNTDAPRPDVLTETVIEMSDSHQVPTVWKSVHVAEEVVLRKQVSERKERVRETLRRDVVEVEHDEKPRFATAQAVEAEVEVLPPRREAPLPAVTEAVAERRPEPRPDAAAADKRHQDEAAQDRKPGQPAPAAPQAGGPRKG